MTITEARFGTVINTPMHDLDDVRRRMRISNLEARLELHEIEIAALSTEISSPLTSSHRSEEANERRDAQQAEWWKIKAELDEMRRSAPTMDPQGAVGELE